jgi:hypothetical protein
MLMSSRFLYKHRKRKCISAWGYEKYINGRSTIPNRIKELEKEGKVNGVDFIVYVELPQVRLALLT